MECDSDIVVNVVLFCAEISVVVQRKRHAVKDALLSRHSPAFQL